MTPAAPAAGAPTPAPSATPASAPPSVPPPIPAAAPKAPPPFPVLAPPKAGKTTPPIPHVSVKSDVPEAEKEAPASTDKAGGKRKLILLVGGLAALLVVGGGGFFAYTKLMAPEPAPPPVVKKAVAPAPVVKAPTPAPAGSGTQPVATGTQATAPGIGDQIAHMPANAINKAKEALKARDGSGQTRPDGGAGGDLGDKPAAPAGSVTQASTGMAPIGRGVSASIPIEAAVDASAEFRSFVALMKVSGVFQGSPARAFINGRLARAGEIVEANLGITFSSVDPERRQLVFKDKSGAIVTRKY